jgi:hypothetical protein
VYWYVAERIVSWVVGNEWDLWDSCDLWVGWYEPRRVLQGLATRGGRGASWLMDSGS